MPHQTVDAALPQEKMREKMSQLCEKMPALNGFPGVRPWNPEIFVQAQYGRSHGERLAASFAMTVWSGDARHPLKPFCMVDAAAVCDGKTRTIMAAWLLNPFWP